MKRTLALTALLVVLAVATGAGVKAEGSAEIIGRLTPATPGSTLPAGLIVRLDGFRQSDRLPTSEVVVGADGVFAFADVAAGGEYAYLVSFEAEGVRYSSDILQVVAGEPTAVQIDVFAVTETDPGISFQSLTRLLRRQTADTLSVVEVAEVHVPGNRAYLPVQQPGLPPPLRFGVPDGAFNLQPVAGFGPGDAVIGGPTETPRRFVSASVAVDHLPPGRYVARALVLRASDEVARLHRPFQIAGSPYPEEK